MSLSEMEFNAIPLKEKLRHVVRVWISDESMLIMLNFHLQPKGTTLEFEPCIEIPEKALVKASYYDAPRAAWCLVLLHWSFDRVDDCAEIPALDGKTCFRDVYMKTPTGEILP